MKFFTQSKTKATDTLKIPSRGPFHLSFTVLFAIGHQGVFRLGGWSPLLPTGFHVSSFVIKKLRPKNQPQKNHSFSLFFICLEKSGIERQNRNKGYPYSRLPFIKKPINTKSIPKPPAHHAITFMVETAIPSRRTASPNSIHLILFIQARPPFLSSLSRKSA